MTPANLPLTQDLVLIGGGHAHALVLRRWGMRPLPGARLTLINPGPTAPYTGMLPGFVAGHYGRDDLEIDLVRLARFAGARLILGQATGIDRGARLVRIEGRPAVAYDLLSVDVGITSAMPDLPGFTDHGVAAKPLGPFAARWAAYRDGDGPASIVVIGGGVGGVELSMAMDHALNAGGRARKITVVDRGDALPGLDARSATTLRGALTARGIALIEGAAVERVEADGVVLADGRRIPSDFTTGAAGARPWPWLAETGLEVTDGYLNVDSQLRSSDPAIYAAGDCAHMIHAPRPKAGVFAVRAAPILAHNLRADLSGAARRAYHPQRDFIKLISLGGKAALFQKWGLSLSGPGLWRMKDRIDRRFMDRLRDLPAMTAPPPPAEVARGVRAEVSGDRPMCAGCGSKVGPGTLERTLKQLGTGAREDVLSAPGDDAAILRHGDATQVISTDHLRSFCEDPYVFARIAALHALGDIWAMGAAPQAALASVILPRMSESLQGSSLSEVMAGATGAFAGAGAVLTGGHTTLGAEFTLGFTVTGLVPERPLTLSGARPGDALILTRPIGTGTLLAAEMRMKARGADVVALLDEMQRPQGPAARLLAEAGARAMTDVTGFGLAGHLLNILQASGVGADAGLEDIPVFDGALALADAGVRSTLYPANRVAALTGIEGGEDLADSGRAALLFDPQTAGGMLAAVPEETADAVLGRLRDAGYGAARIGSVRFGTGITLT